MPALYENWNKEGEDITLECVGNNLPSGLNSDIISSSIISRFEEIGLPIGPLENGKPNVMEHFTQVLIEEIVDTILFANRVLSVSIFVGIIIIIIVIGNIIIINIVIIIIEGGSSGGVLFPEESQRGVIIWRNF
jgi:hypothetical protein